MSLQTLLYWLKWRRDLLISPDEIWWSSLGYDRRIDRARRRHRKGLKLLIAWADVRTCASPDNHRQYWRRVAGQQYECEVCARLLQEVN